MNMLVLIFVIVGTIIVFNQKDSKNLKLWEKLLLIGASSLLIYWVVRFAFLLEKYIN